VEISRHSSTLSGLQYPSRLRYIEHSLLTEHIYVVNAQLAGLNAPLDVGKLYVNNIVGRLVSGYASVDEKIGMEIIVHIVFRSLT